MHRRDATDAELLKTENATVFTANSTLLTENATEITEKATEITEKATNFDKKNMICQKCFKEFRTPHGLKNHHQICKGVFNILECQFCNKVFACHQSKSKHMQRCKIRKAKEQVNMVIPNTNNITNNTNNQQIVYIYNCRISKDDFNSKYETNNENVECIHDFGKEDISYISQEQMHQIAMNCDFKTLVNEIHFNPEHPENHNIRNNCSKSYKVLKDKKWRIEPKENVCSEIYTNSRKKVFSYAHTNLLHNSLNDKEIERYMLVWRQYDKIYKKSLYKYIDVNLNDMLRQKSKKDTIQSITYLENKKPIPIEYT